MPDVIVALFTDTAGAERVRTELVREGFAADRVDVASTSEPGPASAVPINTRERRFNAFFSSLLAKSVLAAEAGQLAEGIERGDAAVIIHPRGGVEVADADRILARHNPKLVRRDIRESLTKTPVVGEHAAGKR